MIALLIVFYMFLVVFACIGAMRGWMKGAAGHLQCYRCLILHRGD